MEESEILDASILIEKVSGTTTIFGIIEYPPASENCDIIFPGETDFEKAVDIAWKLRKAGKPVGTVDIIVAGMCINRNAKLVTKDRDFEHIKNSEPAFKVEIKK